MDNNNISFEDLTGTSPDPQPIKNKSNGYAIASLVLGIISVVCCCTVYLSIILGILAIVFFAIDKNTNGRSNGMAVAGLVLGIFGVLFGVIAIISSIAGGFADYESIYSSLFDSLYGETGAF